MGVEMENITGAAVEAAEEVKDTAVEAAEEVKAEAAGAAEEVKAEAAEAAQEVKAEAAEAADAAEEVKAEAADAAEEVKAEAADAAEAVEDKTETMADYADTLDSMPKIKQGDIVEGKVASVGEKEILVDISYGAMGIIRANDFSEDRNVDLASEVKAGDTIKALVTRMDDGNGNVLLNRRKANDILIWDVFENKMNDKEIVPVTVREAVKGGVVGYVDGVRAFIPASKLSLSYVEDLSAFVGQTLDTYPITVDKEKKKLVLSARDVLVDRRKQEKAEKVAALQPGQVLEGKVASLQTYGAFVTLTDGVDGLVHVSQITSAKRVNHPSEVLSVGDTVKVKVTAVKDGKISLSMKALEEGASDKKPERSQRPSSDRRRGDKSEGKGRDKDSSEDTEYKAPKSEPLTVGLGFFMTAIK